MWGDEQWYHQRTLYAFAATRPRTSAFQHAFNHAERAMPTVFTGPKETEGSKGSTGAGGLVATASADLLERMS